MKLGCDDKFWEINTCTLSCDEIWYFWILNPKCHDSECWCQLGLNIQVLPLVFVIEWVFFVFMIKMWLVPFSFWFKATNYMNHNQIICVQKLCFWNNQQIMLEIICSCIHMHTHTQSTNYAWNYMCTWNYMTSFPDRILDYWHVNTVNSEMTADTFRYQQINC